MSTIFLATFELPLMITMSMPGELRCFNLTGREPRISEMSYKKLPGTSQLQSHAKP
jgi:hypothetical protein